MSTTNEHTVREREIKNMKTSKNTEKKNTETTRANKSFKTFLALDITCKNNKKNDVYSDKATNKRLFDVYTSKRNAIVYLHENIDTCVNAQHKRTIENVLKKYNATANKNYSERDKFKYRVSVSVDTFDTFLNDVYSACKYVVNVDESSMRSHRAQRAKKSTESAQNDTESAQSTESESVS